MALLKHLVQRGITRLLGAVLLEQNDEFQLKHRYMQLESMTASATPQIKHVQPL